MLGSMAAIPLPRLDPTPAAAERLRAALFDADRIEVPVLVWPVRGALRPGQTPSTALVRLSAQHYNRIEEYQALAESLVRHVGPAAADSRTDESATRPPEEATTGHNGHDGLS
jgi:hypothetical protein